MPNTKERTQRRRRKRILINIGLSGVGLGLTALLAFGSLTSARHRKQQGTQLATLVDQRSYATSAKMKDAGHLFFDTDGNTNTAEIVVYYHTYCPYTVEALRHTQIGRTRKISEWKGFLDDGCPLPHADWAEIQKSTIKTRSL